MVQVRVYGYGSGQGLRLWFMSGFTVMVQVRVYGYGSGQGFDCDAPFVQSCRVTSIFRYWNTKLNLFIITSVRTLGSVHPIRPTNRVIVK